jgi:hypothetical protein
LKNDRKRALKAAKQYEKMQKQLIKYGESAKKKGLGSLDRKKIDAAYANAAVAKRKRAEQLRKSVKAAKEWAKKQRAEGYQVKYEATEFEAQHAKNERAAAARRRAKAAKKASKKAKKHSYKKHTSKKSYSKAKKHSKLKKGSKAAKAWGAKMKKARAKKHGKKPTRRTSYKKGIRFGDRGRHSYTTKAVERTPRGKKIIRLHKGQSIYYADYHKGKKGHINVLTKNPRRRSNPYRRSNPMIDVKQYFNSKNAILAGSIMAGGALFAVAAYYASKVPVVGSTVKKMGTVAPSLLGLVAGSALYLAGNKVHAKGIPHAVGLGLIAAGFVGLGINLKQKLQEHP